MESLRLMCLMSQPTCVSFLIMSISLWLQCTHVLIATSSGTLTGCHAMAAGATSDYLLYLHSHQMSIQIQKGLQPNSKVYLKRWPVNVCPGHSPFIYMNVNVVMQLTLATGSEMGNDEKLILYPQVHIFFALCHLA